MDFKYNYIIAGGSGFYEVAYSDLYNLPNVVYFKNYIDSINSKIKQLLIRINFNLKLNDFISKLGKLATISCMYNTNFTFG